MSAFRLLTRIPLGDSLDTHSAQGAAPWFPVVGVFVGLATGGVYALLYAWLPTTLGAVIAVGVGVLLTGAFHEDGFADSCDAFGSAVSGEEALRVMRDSRLGTFGTLAVVFSILWRVVALGSLTPVIAVTGLVVAHVLGRTAAVGLMASAPAARLDGLGSLGVAGITRRGVAFATVTGVAVALATIGWLAGLAVAVVALAAVTLRFVSMKRLGGTTGDVLGACEQLGEMGSLAVVAAAAWAGWQPWWLG